MEAIKEKVIEVISRHNNKRNATNFKELEYELNEEIKGFRIVIDKTPYRMQGAYQVKQAAIINIYNARYELLEELRFTYRYVAK